MVEYAKVNNSIIKVDDNGSFWVYDRNSKLLCSLHFSYAADAINWAYHHQQDIHETVLKIIGE